MAENFDKNIFEQVPLVVSIPIDPEIVGTVPEPLIDVPEIEGRSGVSKAVHTAKRTVQLGIIAAEVGPFNEAIRFGTFAAAQAISGNALVGAAALGGSTFIVEGAAALATAELITTNKSTKTINWINKKLHKIVPEDAKMTPVAEAGVAMFGGSVVVLAEKQREDPERTASQNRKHGIFTAGWMAGVFAVEGALISEGISDFHDMRKLGVALLAVAGVSAVSKKASTMFKKNGQNSLSESD